MVLSFFQSTPPLVNIWTVPFVGYIQGGVLPISLQNARYLSHEIHCTFNFLIRRLFFDFFLVRNFGTAKGFQQFQPVSSKQFAAILRTNPRVLKRSAGSMHLGGRPSWGGCYLREQKGYIYIYFLKAEIHHFLDLFFSIKRSFRILQPKCKAW